MPIPGTPSLALSYELGSLNDVTDAHIHPTATGPAKKTVDEHEKESDIIFYAGWFCPFVQRSWIALEIKGIDYSSVSSLFISLPKLNRFRAAYKEEK